MSEQAEQTSAETGSVHLEPRFSASSETSLEPMPAASEIASDAEAPGLVPEQAAATPEVHAPKVEKPKVDTPKAEAPRTTGKLLIMSPADRDWADHSAGPRVDHESKQSLFGKRRLAALAAVVALAVIAGAVGGAAATLGLQHLTGADAAVAAAVPAGNPALEATVARIDSDIQALKSGIEHASRTSISQLGKTNDRLDKLEKAQAEPAAKLAKLSEAVEKLHAPAPTPVAAATPPAAAKDVTGSVTPPATTAALKTDAKPDPRVAEAKPEVGRLPTIDSWILRDVDRGGALIEGRQGVFEIYAGDVIPGIGRVDAIRRQDGRWVVVTSKGLIVAR